MRDALRAPHISHFRFRFACACAVLFFAAAIFPSLARAQGFVDDSKWEIGGHYALLHLPSQCSSATCETINNGLGANLTYNFSRWLGFDSEMNFFQSNGDEPTAITGGNVTEGLFGFRLGPTTRKWGFYSIVRPGFVSFSRVLDMDAAVAGLAPTGGAAKFAGTALPGANANPLPVNGGGVPQFSATLRYQAGTVSNPLAVMGFTSATYFAFNYGEAIEWRPTRHAALRFDVGDTIVAYPGATIGTPLHQHNFQISQAIIIRF
ncbi:MAG TPA: hypothetical protein VFU57_06470 [Candidatus Acidoferrales bacterium]|nr:hypothetical protein [Candidatus Acidoferrales bacterium]